MVTVRFWNLTVISRFLMVIYTRPWVIYRAAGAAKNQTKNNSRMMLMMMILIMMMMMMMMMMIVSYSSPSTVTSD